MEVMALLERAQSLKTHALTLTSQQKNEILDAMAQALERRTKEILAANRCDLQAARGHISETMLDRLMLNEKRIDLTPTEFDILWLLCENRGQVISSEQLFEQVWGEKYLNSNNTVMVHIRHLREKMGEPFRNPRFIKTVWGVGYKIE